MDGSRREFFKAGLAFLGAGLFSYSGAKEKMESVVVAHPSYGISGGVATLEEGISLMGTRDYTIQYGRNGTLIVRAKIETLRSKCEHPKLRLHSKNGAVVDSCQDCDCQVWFPESSR